MPFGSSSFDHDKVGYLTVEQAMADFAVLVTELKIQFKAMESKVVAFGGRWVVLFNPIVNFQILQLYLPFTNCKMGNITSFYYYY